MTEATEKLRTEQKGFKVWKNPEGRSEPPLYLGEVYPREGFPCLTSADLEALGFGPGRYTLLAPENAIHSGLLSKWQSVEIVE